VLTFDDMDNDSAVALLAKWREMHNAWFPAQFKVTFEGTRKWLRGGVIENPDRILFMLEGNDGSPLGHMGFYRFDFDSRTCEVDNVVRGEETAPGIMTCALAAMMVWGYATLQVSRMLLSTYSENEKAVSLYKRCGFEPLKKIPLVKKESPGRVEWVDAPEGSEPERYSLVMSHKMDFSLPWASKESERA